MAGELTENIKATDEAPAWGQQPEHQGQESPAVQPEHYSPPMANHDSSVLPVFSSPSVVTEVQTERVTETQHMTEIQHMTETMHFTE